MSFLSVHNISKTIDSKPVLSNINFTITAKTKLGIVGETGSGKSTLLKIIGGHEQATAGQVFFYETEVEGLDFRLLPGHPGIAYLSQHFELLNNYKVYELLDWADKLDEGEAAKVYRLCKIDHLLQRETGKLSGGERQRIALARLLVGNPKLLLLDEPFSNLDNIHKSILKKVIEGISEHLDITIIMVSHDTADLLSWADKIIVLQDGNIMQKNIPLIIYNKPVNSYTAALFGKYNKLNTAQAKALQIHNYNIDEDICRPSSFIINTNKEGLAATVNNTNFLGSHYEVEVKTPYGRLIINSLKPLELDEDIYISLI